MILWSGSRGRTGLFVTLLCLTFLSACSSRPSGSPPDNTLPKGDQGGVEKVGQPYKIAGRWYRPERNPGYDVVGLASWYGKQFHGKKTANGEVFNMNALTAAHKTLPLPTFVKVTNLSNGRSLVLRVNDRGPFVDDRIIDVSRRAAQILGFESKGVTQVRVQISDENGKVAKPRKSRDKERHFVQIGAFASKANAEQERDRARDAGARAKIEEVETSGTSLWRVRVGPFKTVRDAGKLLSRLRDRGFFQAQIFTETP